MAVRRAAYLFRSGERKQAIALLQSALQDASKRGFDLPRHVFRYEQSQGDKVFRITRMDRVFNIYDTSEAALQDVAHAS